MSSSSSAPWNEKDLVRGQGIEPAQANAEHLWNLERQRREADLLFLNEITEELSRHSSPVEIMQAAGARIGEYLKIATCSFTEVDESRTPDLTVSYSWGTPALPILDQSFRTQGFLSEELRQASRAGNITTIHNTQSDPRTEAEAYSSIGFISFVLIPFHTEGKWRCFFSVSDTEPRHWRDDEIELVQELASRIFLRIERARTEEALKNTEDRLRKALSRDSIGVLFFTLNGRMLDANPAFERMSGYSREELLHAVDLKTLTPPEFLPLALRAAENLARTGETPPYEKQLIRKDGSRWWGLFAPTRLSGEGDDSEYVEFITDITEQKKAESALRESEQRFQLFVENVREYALIQTDMDYRITSWNPGAERIFGYSTEEAVGRDFSQFLTPEDRKTELIPEELALTQGERKEDARWLIRKDGSRLWTRWVTEPIQDHQGRIIGLAKILRDETERLKTETSLRQSEKLAVVGRLASSIAHEINNPLAAVINLVYLARNSALSSEVMSFLDQAQAELSRISHIATETLRFHRQTSGPVGADLIEILESVLLLHEGRLRGAHIRADRRYRPHPSVVCLPSEIRQVLANLVGNAIDAMGRNTDERSLTLRVQGATHAATGVPGVRVTIADTGSGISAASKRRIFEPFFTTKETTGTGLGLWISAEIIRKHKGALRLRSRQTQPCRGTAFSLFLPQNPGNL